MEFVDVLRNEDWGKGEGGVVRGGEITVSSDSSIFHRFLPHLQLQFPDG